MTMKAYAHKKKGGPEVLEIIELPIPIPTGHDLLVKIIAVATNPVDGKVRNGPYASADGVIDPPKILGWDASGVVESIGEKVTTYKKGDEVFFAGSIIRQGCFAEYTLVDERIVGRKPKSLNWEQAAAIPLCALTAWEPLLEGASIVAPLDGAPNVNENKTLLVIGGAGGVGSLVIQVAKKILKIGKVIATASRPETVEWCKKMGADIVINHNNLQEQLTSHGIQGGVHYTYVTVDINKVWDTVVEITRPCGKIIGVTGWDGVTPAKMNKKRITLVSEYMFCRSMFDEEQEKQSFILNTFSDLLDRGIFVHTQNHHFEWSQLREAQDLQESGKAIGKIALTVKF